MVLLYCLEGEQLFTRRLTTILVLLVLSIVIKLTLKPLQVVFIFILILAKFYMLSVLIAQIVLALVIAFLVIVHIPLQKSDR